MNSNKSKQFNLDEPLPIGPVRRQIKEKLRPRLTHGGKRSVGKRKNTRPFSPQSSQHLILSSARAKGKWSLLHHSNHSKIQSMIYRYAERFKVRVYQSKNTGCEIHLLVRAREKKQLSDFLRVLAGRVAVSVTGAKKNIKKVGKFWDFLCWSRLVNWGQDFYHTRIQIQKDSVHDHYLEDCISPHPHLKIIYENSE